MGVEVAVRALGPAERPVDVDAEAGIRRDRAVARSEFRCCRLTHERWPGKPRCPISRRQAVRETHRCLEQPTYRGNRGGRSDQRARLSGQPAPELLQQGGATGRDPLAPAGMAIETFDLAPIQPYNEDVKQQGFPPAEQAFREKIRAADAVLIVTPEYNRGVSGVLKTGSTGSRGRPTSRSTASRRRSSARAPA